LARCIGRSIALWVSQFHLYKFQQLNEVETNMSLHFVRMQLRRNSWKTTRILLLGAGLISLARAQPRTSGPDAIVFTTGEKLAGHFVRSTSSSVTFKSDALGDLKIDWSKVKELQTSTKVAVIRKGVKLRGNETTTDVAQGTLAMRDQKFEVTPTSGGTAQSVPVADSAVVIDQAAFERALTRKPGFLSDWTGTITVGATLVEATQNNRALTGTVNLIRAEPMEDWLDPSYRTSLVFSGAYGELTQPRTPSIKTSIFHAAVQQDQYVTPSVFAFGQADFDHNYSQGLDVQQTYSAGIGWTAIKTETRELDLKASLSYIRQQFLAGLNGVEPQSINLIGSVFGEHYQRNLPRGIVLNENLALTPAWNNTRAYSGLFNTLLTIPVLKRLSGSVGVTDTFLNNPPAGFNKNSFLFTLGITYKLQ
jgi:hypothetical protein